MDTLSSAKALLANLPLLRLRPWRELGLFALVLMETSWMALFYHSLPFPGVAASFQKSFATLGSLFLLALALTYAMNSLKLDLTLQRRILLGVLVVNLVVGLKVLLYEHQRLSLGEILSRPVKTFADFSGLVPAEFIALLAVALVWWRGVELAQKHMEPNVVLGSFRTGILVFGVYGLLWRQLDQTSGAALYIFLSAGLLAMSTARISALSILRGGRQTRFDRAWMAGLFLAACGVAALGLLAVGLLRDYAATALLGVYQIAIAILGVVVFALVIPPLTLLLKALLALGSWGRFDELLAALSDMANRFLRFVQNLFGPGTQGSDLHLPAIRPVLLWSILIFIALMIAAAISIQVRRHRFEDEETEQVLSRAELLEQLRQALRRQLQKMKDRLLQLSRWRRPGQILAAARVRRIYWNLMRLSRRLGSPRPESQTPLEFLPALESIFPGLKNDLDEITATYLRVRYGELSETLQEVETVEAAWRRVSLEGRAKLSAQRRRN